MTGQSERFPVPVVRAAGSRHDVGLAHGATVSDMVAETLEWTFEELAHSGVSRSEALSGSGQLLNHVAARAPALLDELQGIAQGAGLTQEEVGVINARYELMNILGKPQLSSVTECTVFGLAGDRGPHGQAIVGQNVDLGPDSVGLWIVLDVAPHDAPRVATVTLAGMLAQEGINSAGLALCGSMVLARGWRFGYPTRKFLRREVMEQASVGAAIDLIQSCPDRASSHNLMLADSSGRLLDVETTVDDVAIVEPTSGTLVHANHFDSPGFRNHNQLIGNYLHNSQTRSRRLHDLLHAHPGSLSMDTLQGALRDHATEPRSICRHADTDESGAETNLSIISEPARGTFHVAFGPPCESAYTTYSIS